MAKTASSAMVRASGVRQIDNGFIVCRPTDGPKGYKYTETYSATKPKIEVPQVKVAAAKSASKKR